MVKLLQVFRRRRVAAWLLAVLPAVLLTLHGLAILPLAQETIVVSSIQPFEGRAYVAPLPRRASPQPDEPAEVLFENGREMPFPQMSGWGPVATDGFGRYRVNADTLYLSTTDNSDPRTNGRVYSVRRPVWIPKIIVGIAWLAAVFGTAIVGIQFRTAIARFVSAPPFAAVAGMFIVLALANRVWFFVDYPIPGVHPDSGGYFDIAEQIGAGSWPDFGIRPPVYPVFLKVVYSMFAGAVAVTVIQSCVTLAACLILLYGAYRWSPALSLPAMVAVALFFFGVTTAEHDTAVLSESLYTSLLILAYGGLLAGIRSADPWWLGPASTAMALAILTRPAGVFLEVVYVIVAAWLLIKRYSVRATVSFLAPFPLVLLLMCAYNWKVVGVFATTTWGEANLAGATLLSWQTDPDYPPEVNASIVQIQDIIAKRYVATNKDPSVLETSWDPDVLSPVFLDGFNWEALGIAINLGGRPGVRYDVEARGWIRRVSLDAILKRPDRYVKFVSTMMFNYYRPMADFDFRLYLLGRLSQVYVARTFDPTKTNRSQVQLARDYADAPLPPLVTITDRDPATATPGQDRILIRASPLWRIYEWTHHLRAHLFDSWFRCIGALSALVASLIVLVRTRLSHAGAFVVFILTISTVGASLVVSLVEYSQGRYSYPMEWTYGLSIVLLPLVFMTDPVQPRSAMEEAPRRS